jgi:hypothetical protein
MEASRALLAELDQRMRAQLKQSGSRETSDLARLAAFAIARSH